MSKVDPGVKGYNPARKRPTRQPHPCPHCNLVYYGKSALTQHINAEHWNA